MLGKRLLFFQNAFQAIRQQLLKCSVGCLFIVQAAAQGDCLRDGHIAARGIQPCLSVRSGDRAADRIIPEDQGLDLLQGGIEVRTAMRTCPVRYRTMPYVARHS